MKPGWQTSEFWMLLAVQLVALLVLTGVLTPLQGQEAKDIIAKAIEAVIALVVQGATLWKYISSRTELKQQ